ncbi:hypothetical protein [Nostoc sp. C052]|nr:hypothetical protein [Nostoc sp. C052]
MNELGTGDSDPNQILKKFLLSTHYLTHITQALDKAIAPDKITPCHN